MFPPSLNHVVSIHATAVRRVEGIIRKLQSDQELEKRFPPDLLSRLQKIIVMLNQQSKAFKE